MHDSPAPGVQEAQQTTYERKRLNELFRYFKATSRAVHATPPDIDSSTTYAQHIPRLSADPNLNALAQLGATRLNCDRAFISLIDGQNQHIISETTRSISLVDTDIHVPGDELCMGEVPLDLFAGVCAGTIPIFTSQTGEKIQTKNIYADQSRYVINDFTQDSAYKTRPYVAGFPHMRYYAEVPLKSKSGYVLGSYCVVDSKPHSGLDDDGYRILAEIASAIMRHLDLIKTNDEHSRSMQLFHGLHSFALGHRLDDDESGSGKDISLTGSPLRNVRNTVGTMSEHIAVNPQGGKKPEGAPAPTERLNMAPPLNQNASSPDASVETKADFGKAADTLRKAMDLSGVSFLDVMTYSLDFREGSGFERELNRNDGLKPQGRETMSIPLGHSVGPPENMLRSGRQSQSDARLRSLPASVQQTLIQDYPHGQIFNFDDHGLVPGSPSSLDVRLDPAVGVSETHVYLQLDDRKEVWAALQEFLPGATSVIFMPLWDPHRQIWFSGMFAWITDPQRVLLPEDKAYCSAFGKSVMAEVARADLVLTNRAKSDFISSISHELRSPLHGILASSELLRDMHPSPEQLQMIQMIDNCGRTLLDTMEHILDYSKINSLKRRLPSTEPTASTLMTATPIGDSSNLATFDLSMMVEETVESSTFSHRHYTRSGHHQNGESLPSFSSRGLFPEAHSAPTTVVLSIEVQPTWRIHSEIGIWRRILLNILGNALKYTSVGLINVTLGLENNMHLPRDENLKTVKLTITDTGCGMSQDYLRNRVYTPFMQENSLSTGVGLGLSIVRQLVEDLNGSIKIDSMVAVGTQVTVRLPIRFIEDTAQKLDQELWKVPMYLLRPGLRDEEPVGSKSDGSSVDCQNAMTSSFTDQARTWLRADVVPVENLSSVHTGIVAIHEYDVPWLVRELRAENPAFKVPSLACLLVLCPTNFADMSLDLQSLPEIQTLGQPFGPRKLAKAVKTCLQLMSSPRTVVRSNELGFAKVISIQDKASHTFEAKPSPPPPGREAIPKALENGNTSSSTEFEVSVPQKRERNLLLVDDNAINLTLLVAFAKKLDCAFTTAQNGREALEAYQSSDRRFDYVLMDLSMPVMDGFSATSAIRAHERDQDLKPTVVMALTGLGSEKAQQQAASCGFDYFLAKPVSLQRLKDIMASKYPDSSSPESKAMGKKG